MKPSAGGESAFDQDLHGAPNVDKASDLPQRLLELYRSARPGLLNYVRQMMRSDFEAEDIVQSTFLKTFDQAETHRIENLQAWLYRVAHNLAIDAMRRKVTHDQAVSEWVHTKEQGSVPSAEQESINQQTVLRALATLNERERACLLLRADGFSYSEIGEVLQISAKSVSVYLARAIKKVRTEP
jgi:RNA polymerase sigma-70 factor (ECF subfamily)